jgi:hypothetical protein
LKIKRELVITTENKYIYNKLMNLNLDPFTIGENNEDTTRIHIRVQQRNGRLCFTTIQGYYKLLLSLLLS